MLTEYLKAAMQKAHFEHITGKEPVYGEIKECKGVWATGKTKTECRHKLGKTLEDWVFVRIRKGLPIPSVNGKSIQALERISYAKTKASQMA